uniref:Uncharacterized protein n=1 Tax=Arundo donax TaxID=35708 RepID=A0A0A9GRA2_ARUDO
MYLSCYSGYGIKAQRLVVLYLVFCHNIIRCG